MKNIVIKLAIIVVILMAQFKGFSQNVSNKIIPSGSDKSSDYVLRLIINPVTGELIIKADMKVSTCWKLIINSNTTGKVIVNEKILMIRGENTIIKKHVGKENTAKNIKIMSLDGKIILSETIIW